MAVVAVNQGLIIPPKRLSADEIWEAFHKRRMDGRFIDRNERYARQLAYFEGQQDMGRGVTAMNSVGKPMLKLGTALEMNRTISANRIAPIVLDHQSQTGRMPTSRVEPPTHDEAGILKSEKQSKYLYSTYELCSMDMQHVQAGFFLSALGDALYLLEIDFPLKRAVISGVDPRYAFPRWRAQGWRRFDLWDVIVARPLSPDDLKEQYDFEPRSDREDDCMVVTYVSPFQFTEFIGKDDLQVTRHVPWRLDFCPAVWMNNHITDGQMGNADIRHILEMQDYYNFVLNLRADGLYEMTYPLRGIKDPLELGEGGQVPIGPNEVIPLGEKGDIITSAPTPPPIASDMILQQLTTDMNSGAGTTEIRAVGMPDRSNVSGRALQTAQHPESMRLDIKQIIQAQAFMKLNTYVMALQERAPLVGDVTIDIAGEFKGKIFNEPFTPIRDIAGWYRNKVVWDQLLGLNTQQKAMVAIELRKGQLIDDLGAMEMMGEDDPLAMRKRIEDDLHNQARLQGDLQQASAPGGPGGPGGAGPGPAPGGAPPPDAGAPAGGGPSAAPPAPIFRPPSLAAPPIASGVPAGVSLNAVRQVLGQVNLKGKVYAIGELALMGQSEAPQLAITDHRDHAKVQGALRSLEPKGKVTFVPEDKLPSLKEVVAGA